jgi:UDP-4-amino-4,6-dideoxy-N-acetyl-beta-L-altrosamine N-acetyltransferase
MKSCVIEGHSVLLAEIAAHDLETVRQWRNDPSISRFMLTQQEITQPQQQAWFNKIRQATDQKHFIISYKGDKIGVANIKTVEGEAIDRQQVLEAGIYIADNRYRGTVLAFFPALALNDYCFNELMCEKLVARVLPDNTAALRFNETMGYKVVMQGDVIQMQLTHEDYVQSTTGLRRLIR